MGELTLDPRWTAPAAAAVLVFAPGLWRHARHGVTLVHEIGHAVAALLTRRRLRSITLRTDTSGLTVSRGRPRGPGMVITAAAGYLAPSLLGLLLVAVLSWAAIDAALWGVLGVLVIVAVHVRNVFGAAVVLIASAGTWLLVARAGPELREAVVLLVAWFLLLGGPHAVLELWAQRRRRTGTTDVDILARLTWLPASVWNLLLLLAGVTAICAAVAG